VLSGSPGRHLQLLPHRDYLLSPHFKQSGYPLIWEAAGSPNALQASPNRTPTRGSFWLIPVIMQKRLTSKTVEALPAANGKGYEAHDELVRGFMSACRRQGPKSTTSTYASAAAVVLKRLGTHPTISLADARENARRILRDVEIGHFEECEREQSSTTPTLGEVVQRFIELYAKPRNRD